MSDLQQEIQQQGATFSPESPSPLGNDSEAYLSIISGSGVWMYLPAQNGLLELSDQDCRQFLHNQSTNQIQTLKPGAGCQTVFVTSTARTLDLATVYVTENSVLTLVSPSQRENLLLWLDRYLFPMDRVKIQDISAEFAVFRLFGVFNEEKIKTLGLEALQGQPEASHGVFNLGGVEVRVAVGNGLGLPGYTLIVPQAHVASLGETLRDLGIQPVGEQVWEQLRIRQGCPAPELELTEDYNPLEAGLWGAISFNKGCYIGQETIARLNTYQGVKQRLWGVKLNQGVSPGQAVKVGEQKIGVLTSCTSTPDGIWGLAYIKTKAGGAGLTVQVGEATGEVVAVPFLTHEYVTGS
ncbi:YgfZ/GcvT domain-containing protein [Spirulina subsalsa]|uniref:CAF17-like 4Fe-4S cluster assembly/insertion protein YgfZ n=1 Tax=Spirulina subsalsa TaxID=54311 RepID=UPI0002FABBE3|nr:folate-binding protein YgfZ [Spirulina subsalsa]